MTCTTLKSTLSPTTVFLLPVMRFAKLNKPPPPPHSQKCLEKNKPPGGLNRGFTVSLGKILLHQGGLMEFFKVNKTVNTINKD